MFRKPKDEYENLSKKQLEKKYDEFAEENQFTRDDERAMIFAALKTFLPGVLLVAVIFAITVILIGKLFGM